MPSLEIVEDETGACNQFSAAGHRSFDVVARTQTLGAFLQGAMQHRRCQPLFRG